MTKTTTLPIADVLAFIGLDKVYRYQPKDGPVTVINAHDIFTAQPALLRAAIVAGMFGKLGNISKGGLSDEDYKATDADLAKAREALVTHWQASGEWNLSGTGRDTISGDMRAAFNIERLGEQASDPKAVKALDKIIGETVLLNLGKEPATFANFLKAVATQLAKTRNEDYDALHAKLVDKYRTLAEQLRAERAKATASVKIDVSDLI